MMTNSNIVNFTLGFLLLSIFAAQSYEFTRVLIGAPIKVEAAVCITSRDLPSIPEKVESFTVNPE